MRVGKKRKYGIAFSVELIVVLIILAGVAAAAFALIGFLKSQWQVMEVVREVQTYTEAISKFKKTYDFWPGDMPVSSLSEGLRDTKMISGINNVSSGASTSAETLGNQMDTGIISYPKHTLSFRQLELASLIPAGLSRLDQIVPNQCPSANLNLYLPTASFDKTVLIGFTTYESSNSWTTAPDTDGNTMPRYTAFKKQDGVAGYGSVFDVNMQSNAAIVFAKNVTGASACGFANVKDALATTPFSPDLAERIDSKIDDGKPSGPQSKVISENHRNATSGWGCVAYPSTAAKTLPTTSAPFFNAKYISNTANDGYNGCMMSFIFQE